MSVKSRHGVQISRTLPPSLVGAQLGVWHLVRERTTRQGWDFKLSSLPSAANMNNLVYDVATCRLVVDVYRMAPILFVLYATSFLLLGINSAFQLRFLNRLFESVSSIFIML